MPPRSRLVFLTVVGIVLSGLLMWHVWPASASQALHAARKRWNDQHVSNYELRLTVRGQPYYRADYTLTVRDNQVQQATCTDGMGGECRDFAPSLTVIGLFTQAQSHYNAQQARPSIKVAIQYDPVYGFPRRIVSYDPTVFDGGTVIEVDHFAILQ